MHTDSPVSKKSSAGFNWVRLYGLMAALVVVAGGAASLWLAASEDARMRSELLVQGRLVADTLNPWRIVNLTGVPSELESPDYERIKSQLQLMRSANSKFRFIYLTKQLPDGRVVFLADSEPSDSKDYSPPGQVYEEATDTFREVFVTGRETVEGPARRPLGELDQCADPHQACGRRRDGGLARDRRGCQQMGPGCFRTVPACRRAQPAGVVGAGFSGRSVRRSEARPASASPHRRHGWPKARSVTAWPPKTAASSSTITTLPAARFCGPGISSGDGLHSGGIAEVQHRALGGDDPPRRPRTVLWPLAPGFHDRLALPRGIPPATQRWRVCPHLGPGRLQPGTPTARLSA